MPEMNLFRTFLGCVVIALGGYADAQTMVVKLRFEIDGKPIKGQQRVILYDDSAKAELNVSGKPSDINKIISPEFKLNSVKV